MEGERRANDAARPGALPIDRESTGYTVYQSVDTIKRSNELRPVVCGVCVCRLVCRWCAGRGGDRTRAGEGYTGGDAQASLFVEAHENLFQNSSSYPALFKYLSHFSRASDVLARHGLWG